MKSLHFSSQQITDTGTGYSTIYKNRIIERIVNELLRLDERECVVNRERTGNMQVCTPGSLTGSG